MLEFSEVASLDTLAPQLREQAESKWRAGFTRHFVAAESGEQLGLLIVDMWPTRDDLAICKVFVPQPFRRRGIGAALIDEAESIARENGREWIRLRAEPFDGTLTKESLVAWYTAHGFVKSERASEELQRRVPPD
jgi:GNAT superfamily N-acetyltransferase